MKIFLRTRLWIYWVVAFGIAANVVYPVAMDKKATLVGQWENEFTGSILDFYDNHGQLMLARYQMTPISVVLEQPPFALTQEDLESIRVANHNLIVEQLIYDKVDQEVTPIPQVPGSPLENFDIFSATFRQFYAFFTTRCVDWDAVVAQFRPQISAETSDEALFDIFKQMITIIKDNHVALSKGSEEKSENYFQFNLAPSFEQNLTKEKAKNALYEALDLSEYVDLTIAEAIATISEHYISDVQQDPTNTIIWGQCKYNTDVGYLSVTSMEYELSDLELVLNEIIDYFNERKVKALIFDVRFNQGGSDEIALAIASRFADSVHSVLTKQDYYSGALGPATLLSLRPHEKQIWDIQMPKVLLTSPITASAAETFVLAISKVPNLTRVGGTTMGILSDQFARKLPNGWLVTLSNEVRLTPEGRSYEAIGIPTQMSAEFPFFSHLLLKQDPGVNTALTVLHQQ